MLWCDYFLVSAASWWSCSRSRLGGRARDTHNAVRHVQLFSGKKTKLHACPSIRAGKWHAASKQTRPTIINHYNSLRQQASPDGGLLTPSSHGCQCSDESMIAWPPASLLPRLCSGLLLLPRHHGCSDESMLAGRLTPLGTIRVRFEVSHRPPLS